MLLFIQLAVSYSNLSSFSKSYTTGITHSLKQYSVYVLSQYGDDAYWTVQLFSKKRTKSKYVWYSDYNFSEKILYFPNNEAKVYYNPDSRRSHSYLGSIAIINSDYAENTFISNKMNDFTVSTDETNFCILLSPPYLADVVIKFSNFKRSDRITSYNDYANDNPYDYSDTDYSGQTHNFDETLIFNRSTGILLFISGKRGDTRNVIIKYGKLYARSPKTAIHGWFSLNDYKLTAKLREISASLITSLIFLSIFVFFFVLHFFRMLCFRGIFRCRSSSKNSNHRADTSSDSIENLDDVPPSTPQQYPQPYPPRNSQQYPQPYSQPYPQQYPQAYPLQNPQQNPQQSPQPYPESYAKSSSQPIPESYTQQQNSGNYEPPPTENNDQYLPTDDNEQYPANPYASPYADIDMGDDPYPLPI